MSVQSFTDILQGPLTQYLQISQQIGGDVGQHSQLVHNAFQVQLQYLILASQSKQPSQNEIISLLKPTSDQISAIQGIILIVYLYLFPTSFPRYRCFPSHLNYN